MNKLRIKHIGVYVTTQNCHCHIYIIRPASRPHGLDSRVRDWLLRVLLTPSLTQVGVSCAHNFIVCVNEKHRNMSSVDLTKLGANQLKNATSGEVIYHVYSGDS